MIKLMIEHKGTCPMYEITTIDGTVSTTEKLFSDNKAVWSTSQHDIIKDYKWENVKDYIKWLKSLGYRQLKKYKDNLTWKNPVSGEKIKKYDF